MLTFSCSIGPRRFVDRDIRLALGVGMRRPRPCSLRLPVLAVDWSEHDLGADILQLRTAARERTGEVVDDADLDFLFLSLGGNRHSQHRDGGGQPNEQARSFLPPAWYPPLDCFLCSAFCYFCWCPSHWSRDQMSSALLAATSRRRPAFIQFPHAQLRVTRPAALRRVRPNRDPDGIKSGSCRSCRPS